MNENMLDQLKRLEAEHDVRILYAVESGSRAWGFASQDSDGEGAGEGFVNRVFCPQVKF